MKEVRLGDLNVGASGRVAGLDPAAPPALARRLLELGMVEGESVMVMHEAPFGRDPIAVKVRGTLLALRRQEARHVRVSAESGAASD
ncbi:MAG: ferrous iron transport protein A [Bdellovibrionales bacterium]|nr:ferrous iron transport protein A [Bdellovibrionales bacterium]